MISYYTYQRREILPLLPKVATNILEIGAATGRTLRWMKTIYPTAMTTGVELSEALREELSQNADVSIIGDINQCLPQLKRYDLILLLDVCEHLVDPGYLLRSLRQLLEPGGHVIVSIPNIAHLSVTIPLLFARRFTYQDAGILDRTHLRFFVEDTAIKLLNDAGLQVTKGLLKGPKGRKAKIIDRLSFGLLRHHLTIQYILLGELCDGEIRQQAVNWMTAE
jgi:2-polyprenyl-3-methyl-5-hydroxy-6-metoxy-1,4-benzoquinol methylase